MYVVSAVRVIGLRRMLSVCSAPGFRGVSVHVEVGVPRSVVHVFVTVDALAHGSPDTPGPDTDQDQSHDLLAPRRQEFQGKELAHQDRHDADQHDPAGMAQTPVESGPPRADISVCRERRYRRQMVGPGQHVNRTRRQPRDNRLQQTRVVPKAFLRTIPLVGSARLDREVYRPNLTDRHVRRC